MTKTIKQRVVEKITSAPMTQVGRTMKAVLPHKTILKLSKAEDSATRRLREMAQAYGRKAYEHKDEKIVIEKGFIDWLKKQ
jgi:hypothetical protein